VREEIARVAMKEGLMPGVPTPEKTMKIPV
jgi:hypothetical protein